jgi:hypothetical protein
VGRFLARHYAGAPVAVNDIGAVTWLADVHCLDMLGLASLEVCRRRMALTWGRDAIDELTRQHGVRVAIVYDRWFDRESTGGLPAHWSRVASWRIPRNVVNGEDTVTFYAVPPDERPRLQEALEAYARALPRTVEVRP